MSDNVKIAISAKDQTKRAFKSVQGGLQSIGNRLNNVHTQIGALVGVAGFGALMKAQTEAAAKAVAYAKALDVNVASLSAWQYAAKDVRIEGDKMADIFKDLSEKVGDAFANDAGEGKEALENLGLSVEEMVKLSPDQQLLKIAAALDQVGTKSEKIQILESLASDMSLLLPLLDDNAAGFRNLASEAEASGAVLTELEAESLKQLEETNRKITGNLENLAQNWTLAFGDKFAETVGFISTTAVPAFARLAEKVGILDRNIKSLTLDELWARRGELEHQIDNTSRVLASGDINGKVADDMLAANLERIKELNAIKAQQAALINDISTADKKAGSGGSDRKPRSRGKIGDADSEDYRLWQAIETEEKLDELYEEKAQDRIDREADYAQMWSNVWANSINNFATGIGNAFADVLVDQRNLADALNALMKQVAKQVISSLIEIGIKRTILAATAAAEEKAIVASGVTSAGTLALAYAPAAAAASLASFGANAAPAMAGITATHELSTGLALLGQAHDGMDYVPREGSYRLQKGEMVLDPGTSEQVRNNALGGGDLHVHVSAVDAKSFGDRLGEFEELIWNNLLQRMNEEGRRFA